MYIRAILLTRSKLANGRSPDVHRPRHDYVQRRACAGRRTVLRFSNCVRTIMVRAHHRVRAH